MDKRGIAAGICLETNQSSWKELKREKYMKTTTFQTMTGAFALFAIGAPMMMATNGGAPQGTSGAPGETTCVACHGGQPNSGAGKLRIALDGAAATYTPGQKTRVRVTLEDPSARRWGFELSVKAENGNTQGSAGSLQPVDANTQVLNQGSSQWITHTPSGTRNNTRGPVTFEFDWTSPSSDAAGPLVFYAAGNAANGNGSTSGDLIYASTLRVTGAVAAAPVRPAFAPDAVTEVATRQPGMASGAWVNLTGANLAAQEASWSPSSGQPLPTTLANVKVKVNDVAAAIAFVRPDRVTFLVPAETPEGDVPVVVETDGKASDAVLIHNSRAIPAVLGVPDSGNQVYASVTPAGAGLALSLIGARGWMLGKPGVDARVVRGVFPGEEIDIYAIGMGRTQDEFRTDRLVTGNPAIADGVTVQLGETILTPTFTALVAPGVYVVRVKVPDSQAAGDVPIVLATNSIQSRSNVLLFVQQQ